jgi:hypothetical protein
MTAISGGIRPLLKTNSQLKLQAGKLGNLAAYLERSEDVALFHRGRVARQGAGGLDRWLSGGRSD